MKAAICLAAVLVVAVASPGAGQSLAERVGVVSDGTVVLRYNTRPGVCGGDGDNVSMSRGGDYGDYAWHCVRGPMWVKIARAGGEVVSVRTHVGGRPAGWPNDHDLGSLPADEAAQYFLSLAGTLRGSNAESALAAGVLADAPDPSPQLRQLTLDHDLPLDLRKTALFWWGQSDESVSSLVDVYSRLDSRALREQYTFVLAQRHEDAATNQLIEIVQHDADRGVRKQALFWLGQSKDPRALAFIRDLLTK